MTLDKNHLNEFENISPPMRDALTIPVAGLEVVIYVCRSPFQLGKTSSREVKRVAQALALLPEIVAIVKAEIDNCDHPQCVADRERFGYSNCAGGHIAHRVVDAINKATK
jgi:hypothetical protein